MHVQAESTLFQLDSGPLACPLPQPHLPPNLHDRLVFVAWLFLYFSRDYPLILLGFAIVDWIIVVGLGVVTVVALFADGRIEVKPGKPYPYHSDNVRGRLHITQATLGLGESKERSIVQCSLGHKNPIFLCSLLPNKNESCPLNLEFEDDDLVAFSVIGPRSVHLSGFFVADEGDVIRDDYESYPLPNFKVDDEKPTNVNGQFKQLKKKNQPGSFEDNTNSQHQIVVRGNASVPVLESEDDDGFRISVEHKRQSSLQKPEAEAEEEENKTAEKTKKKKAPNADATTNLKRKSDSIEQDDHPERPKKEKKKKKKKQLKEQAEEENADKKSDIKTCNVKEISSKIDEHDQKQSNDKSLDIETEPVPGVNHLEEKKKKKKKNKKKTQENEVGADKDQTVKAGEDQNRCTSELDRNQTGSKSSKVRTFPNGLVMEELAMGKPDGKKATSGKMVSVRYTGKLQKNGKIFDSNVGRAPFKFRLGVGQVIAGWDVGVCGMRVGDKRRLTIPPSMGYGAKGAGGTIPPNAWLSFDVELVDVR
ncbi:hypothetical protein FEM48_Zijuj03G0142700 [Ziziphus jujuba var. spinosa]|uniref:peptidylprolyl isomerase n=1 Tax=Ziziphus jujuba var. spinosa TaxID=714518 RepID=A0A978VQT2_ZIZJJ|nr:hypothetical protein FEM48_Zijuj03G0142700 [Ziziphus jujuba var. spinosa]